MIKNLKWKNKKSFLLATLLIFFIFIISFTRAQEVDKTAENENKEASKSSSIDKMNNTDKRVLFKDYIDNDHYIYIEKDPIQENFELVRIVKKNENEEKLMFISGLPTWLLEKCDVDLKEIKNDKGIGHIDKIGIKTEKDSNVTELFQLHEGNKYKIVVRIGIVDDAIVGHKVYGFNKETNESFGNEEYKNLSDKNIKWIYNKDMISKNF